MYREPAPNRTATLYRGRAETPGLPSGATRFRLG
jgi:hypothetical protein